MPPFVLSSDVSRAVPLPALLIVTHPAAASAATGTSATFTAAVSGGRSGYRFVWQAFTVSTSTWTNLRDVTLATTSDSFVYDLASIAAGQTRQVRCVITDAAGQTVTTNTAVLTVTSGTGTITPTDQPGGGPTYFWRMSDILYPVPPADGTVTANGQTVVWVSSGPAAQTELAKGNRYVVLRDGANYIPTTDASSAFRLRAPNVSLVAATKHGAKLDMRNVRDQIRVMTDDVLIRGLDLPGARFYAISVGGSQDWGANEFGPCRRTLVEHCRITDSAQSAFHVGTGYEQSGEPPYYTTDTEIRYCEVYRMGLMNASSGNLPHFCEGIYVGSGTRPGPQRALRTNIHHSIFDGTGMIGAGECIEAKIHCEDVWIHDNLISNWLLGDSTSGAAIALLVNIGSGAPTAGTRGMTSMLVERNRIHGTRKQGTNLSPAQYVKASGIIVGHGNTTIRNNLLWDNQDGDIRIQNKAGIDYFSNPAQVDVDILHNTLLSNAPFTVDGGHSTNARIRSVNNAMRVSQSYPTSSITWTAQQDTWNVPATSWRGGAYGSGSRDSGGGAGSGFQPANATVLRSVNSAGDFADAMGNARTGSNRQFGALQWAA